MYCLVCPTPDNPRPLNGGSDFEALFGDLVRGSETLWWAITGGGHSPWSLPPAWYGDDVAEAAFYAQFEEVNDHVVVQGAVFRNVTQYLSDFWLEVYAFDNKPEAIAIESWRGPGLPLAAAVSRGARHSFVNVDGSYWAAFSADKAMLRTFAAKCPLARFVAVARTQDR